MASVAGYEANDLKFRWVVYGVVGLGFLLVVLYTAVLLLTRSVEEQDGTFLSPLQIFAGSPTPALQLDPAEDLRVYLRAINARLHSYGWVDPERGIVHMPIDAAMEQVVEQGLPDWSARLNVNEEENHP